LAGKLEVGFELQVPFVLSGPYPFLLLAPARGVEELLPSFRRQVDTPFNTDFVTSA